MLWFRAFRFWGSGHRICILDRHLNQSLYRFSVVFWSFCREACSCCPASTWRNLQHPDPNVASPGVFSMLFFCPAILDLQPEFQLAERLTKSSGRQGHPETCKHWRGTGGSDHMPRSVEEHGQFRHTLSVASILAR